MGRDKDGFAAQDAGQDLGHVIGPDARARITQAFAARWRNIIGAAPDMHLLLAPLLAGIILVQAGEIAIVTLIERLVADRLEVRLADLVEDDPERVLGALEYRGEGNIELQPRIRQRLTADLRLLDTELRQVRITPAGEEVLQVPFALAVANKD